MRSIHWSLLVLTALLLAGCQRDGFDPVAHRADILAFRQERDHELREAPNSRLALVHREYFGGRSRLTFGSGPRADVRLPDETLAPLHAAVEIDGDTAVVRALSPAGLARPGSPGQTPAELPLDEDRSFRLGRYNVFFRPDAPVEGDAAEIFDTEEPALLKFTGLEFFPIDPAYRVVAELVQNAEPEQINLVDSHGNDRPYWVVGELRFRLLGRDLTLEVYSSTLERAEIEKQGLMLMFGDQTNGEETYPAGRYLDIEGLLSGPLVVDFNRAYTPPCNFSPAYTCPFPRPRNRLPVAVAAGEKKYRGKPATLLFAGTSESGLRGRNDGTE